MNNYLTLAAAGSGKTRGLIEYCASTSKQRRILIVTFTHANQEKIRSRISKKAGDHLYIEVVGWFAFLLKDFARPFIPFKFFDTRVRGFNFEGRPHRYAKGKSRFLDSNNGVYASELGRLSHELISKSKGALIRRLEACYDDILIDEVQYLSAHDWEIMDVLLRSLI